MVNRNNIRDIRQQRQGELDTREKLIRLFPAKIVSVNGSVKVGTRPNYVYVVEEAEETNILAVWNNTVKPVVDLPVMVAERPNSYHRLEIIGININSLQDSEQENAGGFNLPEHAYTHEYLSESNIGIDPVSIYQPAIMMLKTIAQNGDLTVNVQSCVYEVNGLRKLFAGEVVDLSSYVPVTADRVKKILLYLDGVSNLIGVVEGTEVPNNGLFTPPTPLIPRKCIASSLITLETGQTTILTVDHVTDARAFLHGFNISEAYLAERRGEILISFDGATFEAGLPLTDTNGDIITSNGIIVTY